MTAVRLIAPRPRTSSHNATPDRLRDLAARVRRLGVASRLDPERVYEAKEAIVVELRQLARELEGR